MKNKLNNVYVIAEIGINHEGDVDTCAKMIQAAAEVGVDAVKLQTIDADANYVAGTESHSVFKDAELSPQETADMFELAKSYALDIFTTAGDIETIEWVDKLNPSCWKISSGLLTHIPMVRHLASLGRPLLISTGMANIEEIDLAIETVKSTGNNDISLLQCTSLYPAPLDSLNLSTISWLKKRYGCKVGFSDHSLGDDAVFLSIGVGATLVEKHFSLEPSRKGFDHNISLSVNDFKKMVERVRIAEKIMGSSVKTTSDKIIKIRQKFLRSVVAIDSISKGEVFSTKNIGVRRTLPKENGCEPKYFDSLLGLIAQKDFRTNEPINIEGID